MCECGSLDGEVDAALIAGGHVWTARINCGVGWGEGPGVAPSIESSFPQIKPCCSISPSSSPHPEPSAPTSPQKGEVKVSANSEAGGEVIREVWIDTAATERAAELVAADDTQYTILRRYAPLWWCAHMGGLKPSELNL
jgi:hypothetical protein